MPRIKERTITPAQAADLRLPVPKSWYRAAGLLKYKKKALAQHTKTVRREWARHHPSGV